MSHRLKPFEDQTIVLTGASSGIGLATARLAAKRGARLVLAARSEDALRELADEINRNGGEALAVTCDVSRADEIERLHDMAVERFGGYDSWINDAGVGMFGRMLDIPVEDMKKLFETNLWGVIRGSLIAAKHFKERTDRRYCGAIINVGSVLSYQAIPLQGPYVASKHAVKGFTDSLRMELEHDDIGASVTCIMPNAINTPYAEHAPNYLGNEATLPGPLYSPETVARAIVHACATPTRNLTVGGAFKPMTGLNNVFPSIVDAVMKTFMFPAQQKPDMPLARREPRALATASSRTDSGSLHERSSEGRFELPFSGYTQARMHPLVTTAALAGVGLLLAGLAGARRN